MKKVLIIDESPLFRKYLKEKLSEYAFEVLSAINGLDGLVKLRSNVPDLVIMDYYLSRKSSLEILAEKDRNPNTAGIPVIMASNKIDKSRILEVAKYNVKKFLTKPIKIDALLGAVSEALGINLEIDTTPCIIEAHFNEEILFIEVARGLNQEKIDLLKYKITELLELYERKHPKILIIMSDINLTGADSGKLKALFNNVLETTGSLVRSVRILTSSRFVKDFIAGIDEYKKIEVTDNINQAMDGLLGIKVSGFIEEGESIVKQDFLTASRPKTEKEESIHLRFDSETEKAAPFNLESQTKEIAIAAVDDDPVIQEFIKTVFSDSGRPVETFDNGKRFIESLESSSFDLVFLDLLMPEMNGFQVLQHLKENGIELPIIVLSALSQKETVVKAMSFGIKSYMIKPLKPDNILKKTVEILRMNF